MRYFSHVSTAEWNLGNNEKRFELLLRAFAIDSTNISIIRQLGEIYRDMGKWEEALKYWRKYFSIGRLYEFDWANLGYSYLKNGYKKEAEDCFDKYMEYTENYIKLYPKSLINNKLLANVSAMRGDKEKTFEYLNLYKQKPVLHSDILFNTDPWYDNISNEPDFQKIASEIKAKFQAEYERIKKWLEEQGML